jgi:acyl-CoA reductase-like NAD-dependent aldehyde dehydrogenase
MELPETRNGWQAPAASPAFRNRPRVDGSLLGPSPDREFNRTEPATGEAITRIGDGDADDVDSAGSRWVYP